MRSRKKVLAAFYFYQFYCWRKKLSVKKKLLKCLFWLLNVRKLTELQKRQILVFFSWVNLTESENCQNERFSSLRGQKNYVIKTTLISAGEVIFITAKLNQHYCALCKNDTAGNKSEEITWVCFFFSVETAIGVFYILGKKGKRQFSMNIIDQLELIFAMN